MNFKRYYESIVPKNMDDFLFVLKSLNPEAVFAKSKIENSSQNKFFSNFDVTKLVLPSNYEYQKGKGIISPNGTVIEYSDMKSAEEELTTLVQVPDISQTTKIGELYSVLKLLNPKANIRISNPETNNANTLYIDGLEVKDLVMPEGFYYNDKNGITNKNNTQSGAYLSTIIKPRLRDISQSTNIGEIYAELKELNPNVEFGIGNPDLDSRARNRLFVSEGVNISKLVLPVGFEYDEKNGITNKGNTQSGAYIGIDLRSLEKVDSGILLEDEDAMKVFKVKDIKLVPDEQVVERIAVPNVAETNNIADLYDALRILNPKVDFGMGDPSVDPMSRNRLFIGDTDLSKLVLPEGFEYNEKNGLTNKHNTTTGAYMSVKLESMEKADGLMLSEDKVNQEYKDSSSNDMGKLLGNLTRMLDNDGPEM